RGSGEERRGEEEERGGRGEGRGGRGRDALKFFTESLIFLIRGRHLSLVTGSFTLTVSPSPSITFSLSFSLLPYLAFYLSLHHLLSSPVSHSSSFTLFSLSLSLSA